MTSSPEVTVVIPTHNRWHMLPVALGGALRQEEVDIEVLVVDDGSTDGTASKLSEVDDARLHVFRHQRCQGLAKARNRGLAEARGRWVAFLDDDDLWSPRKLRTQLDAASEQNASFAYGSAVFVDEWKRPIQALLAPDSDSLRRLLLGQNVIPAGGSNVIVKTNFVRELGGFDEGLFQLADWDLWIRLSQEGVGAACAEFLVGYLVHPQNMHVTKMDQRQELERLAAKHRSSAEAEGIDFGGLTRLQWAVAQHRSAGRRFKASLAYLRYAVISRSARMFAAGFGVLLGERAMRTASRAIRNVAEPDWLKLYR